MSEKEALSAFEKMLLSPTRPAMQDMYLDLFRAWMSHGFEKSATASDLAQQLHLENPKVFRADSGHIASNLALLAGLIEFGIIGGQIGGDPDSNYVLTSDGMSMVKRHADLIAASKERPVTGDWGDDF